MSGQCSAERREILVAILRYLKALARAGDVSGLQEMGIEKPQEILEVLGLPDVLELPAANQSLFSIQIHPDALINWARYVKE
ncbi:MAG: hypothetical protein GY849_08640, partial [Deltaproteobacteria bacterium]|nr:hypothetical protein [Deltaproteobacteria bacterium]